MHVSSRRLAGYSDQEMSHFRCQVTQCEDREHVRLIQETQFFDVGMHLDRLMWYFWNGMVKKNNDVIDGMKKNIVWTNLGKMRSPSMNQPIYTL